LTFNRGPGKYLAFLGRISPEKRPDLAIDVARKAGIPIKLAAKLDVVDRAYFEQAIKPRLSSPDVEYIGEINESQKNEFLGNALALMFTIDLAGAVRPRHDRGARLRHARHRAPLRLGTGGFAQRRQQHHRD
jgi:glycosyltransferase involved in cell wall biosynthesis